MALYRLNVEWYGKNRRKWSEIVKASDATGVLDYALPGSWREGDFEGCNISIAPCTEEKPDAKTE